MEATDASRLFLQALMSRRVMSEKLIKALFERCNTIVEEQQPDALIEEDWPVFLNGVKSMLEPMGLSIKTMQDEVEGITIYALVNVVGDEIAQLATTFTAAEITFFKQIIEAIITAPNESYSISSMNALKETQHLPKHAKVTRLQAQNILSNLVAQGWLAKSERQRYSLAPRSLLELHKYIEETFADEEIQTCNLCEEFVFKGFRCNGNGQACRTKIHKPCLQRWRQRGGPCRCPVCRTEWPNESAFKIVGEGAAGEFTTYRGGHRRTTDSDDQESEPESEEEPAPKKGRKSGDRGKGKVPSEDEEEEEEEEATMESDSDEPAPRKRSKR